MMRGMLLAQLLGTASAGQCTGQDTALDAGWLFSRSLQAPPTGSTQWRAVTVPHDWQAEDLPPRDEDTVTPVIEIRNGTWLFKLGAGNESWAAPALPDADWTSVTAPHDWRDPPLSVKGANAHGWYRRHFKVSANQLEAAGNGMLNVALGAVAQTDITYINGVRIGQVTGRGCNSYLYFRHYNVPAGVLKTDGSDNVIAVNVTSGDETKPGGLYDSVSGDMRAGPFDGGASFGERSTGHVVGAVGWYERELVLSQADFEGCALQLYFLGAYQNATVLLNGQKLLWHPYGYTSFIVDLAPAAKVGKNTLQVQTVSTGKNSRWYAGAGLYRRVSLLRLPAAAHVPKIGGVYVHSSHVDIAAKTATVTVEVSCNGSLSAASAPVTLSVAITNSSAPAQQTTCHPVSAPTAVLSFSLTGVKLWDPDSPTLYEAVVSLSDPALQTVTETFGVRTVDFSVEGGLKVNGKGLSLYGGCIHHAHGVLGSASYGRAEERKVLLLKEQGYNAIRTSHNPPSPALLDACDRHGVLVMDEAFDCWAKGKNPQDYHLWFADWWRRDMASMVLRDRNHPSIVMWSIGNEIPMRDTPQGVVYSQQLTAWVKQLDPHGGRAVTSAVPGVSKGDDDFIAPLDVAGYNYAWKRYESDHERKPSRIMVGTESFPLESYKNWASIWNSSWVLGDFIWTAFDYIGESSIGSNGYNTPSVEACGGYCPIGFGYHISFCGDFDIVGGRKAQSFYRAVLWNASALEVAVHSPVPEGQHEVVASWGWPDERQSWTWPGAGAGEGLQVRVFSRCDSVQLYLNGEEVGQPTPVSADTQYTATFTVPYTAGKLEARGFFGNTTPCAVRSLETASEPAAVSLVPYRGSVEAADPDNSLDFINVELRDASGTLCAQTTGAELVARVVSGPGKILAAGNGDPTNVASFLPAAFLSFRGRALVVAQYDATAGDGTSFTVEVGPKDASSGVKSKQVTVQVQQSGL